MKKIILFLLAFCLSWSSSFALVVDGEYAILKGETVEIKQLGIRRVSIYEEDIVDIVDTADGNLVFMGLSEGETIIEIGTKRGKHLYKISVFEKDIEDTLRKVRTLLQTQLGFRDIKIEKNFLTNRILLEGEVAEDDISRIQTALGSYGSEIDNFLVPKQSEDIVEIEVQIVEINTDATKALGVSWPSSFTYGEAALKYGLSLTEGVKDINPFFGLMDDQERTGVKATLNFLVTNGKAEILSKPKLSCVSGKEASLQIGGAVPVLTSSDDGSTGVEYVDFGISLSVAPVVRDDDLIDVNLNVEVSDVSSTLSLGSSDAPTASAPATTTRNTQTNILMEDMQTMAISGLIKKKTDEELTKLPWLGDVPVLGKFFTNSRRTNGEDVELVILLTPKLRRVKKDEKDELVQYSEEVKVLGTSSVARETKSNIAFYASQVRDRILASMEYPQELLHAGFEPEFKVSLHLADDGYLLAAKVLESSGLKSVDKKLIATIEAIKFFPMFPATIKERELWLDIPFQFRMED